MPTPFDVENFNLGDLDYVEKLNLLVEAFQNDAVNVADIAGYVAMGGDPATVDIDVFLNGSLGENQVPGRKEGSAAGATVDAIDLNMVLNQSSILAYQGMQVRDGSRA